MQHTPAHCKHCTLQCAAGVHPLECKLRHGNNGQFSQEEKDVHRQTTYFQPRGQAIGSTAGKARLILQGKTSAFLRVLGMVAVSGLRADPALRAGRGQCGASPLH
jgi:hypothetical protein